MQCANILNVFVLLPTAKHQMEGMTGLQSRLAALDSDLAEAQRERESVKRQLESTCHELTVAHATLEQMQVMERIGNTHRHIHTETLL